MFNIGDEVFCNIQSDTLQYKFDSTKPLTITGKSGSYYYLTQPGLWHKFRIQNGVPALFLEECYLKTTNPTIKVTKEQLVINKIKYLDKRYVDRKQLATNTSS